MQYHKEHKEIHEGHKVRSYSVLLFSLCSLWLIFPSSAQVMTPQEYIETYKDIAISEMKRTGIPASITLAQGLIESGNGNSALSKQSNNHFGIKCKKDWTGRSVNYDDDAPQECFRAYDRAEDSYRDHSDFLRAGQRYAFLFELEPTDYKGWANGLKEAGYATNPQYADMLISAIERYELDQYDNGNKRKPIKPDDKPVKPPVFAGVTEDAETLNGIPIYIAKEGDIYTGIAEANYMMRWEVAKYNDTKQGDKIEPGTILYLKPKGRKAHEKFHTVKDGEGMYYIAQLHGIRLKSLYKMNRMKPDEEPAPGEKLSLREKREAPPKLSSQKPTIKALKRPEPKEPAPQKIEPKKEEAQLDIPKQKDPVVIEAPEKPGPDQPATNIHIVSPGETLYSISKKYNVSVDFLKTKNGLADNTISIGQKLVVRD
jgi:LysM repeat protein